MFRTASWLVYGTRWFTAAGFERSAQGFDARDLQRGEEARAAISQSTGNNRVHLHTCDLSDLSDIRRFAREFDGGGHSADCLINNAGLMAAAVTRTREGAEHSFATNVLGTYYITHALLPIMQKSAAAKAPPGTCRVITVSSGGMYTPFTLAFPFCPHQGSHIRCIPLFLLEQHNDSVCMYTVPLNPLNLDSLGPGPLLLPSPSSNPSAATSSFDGTAAYAQHKRIQVEMTERWAKCAPPNVRFYSMHPGWADTPGVATAMPSFRAQFEASLRSSEQGADTVVWLATRPDDQTLENGAFYFDRSVARKHLPLAGTQVDPAVVDDMFKRVKSACESVLGEELQGFAAMGHQ